MALATEITQFRFTRRAEADVEDIADYIARDNTERAFSFVVELRRHCRALVKFPHRFGRSWVGIFAWPCMIHT